MTEVFSNLIPGEWAKTLTDHDLRAVISGNNNLLPKLDPDIKRIHKQATYDKSLLSWETAVKSVFIEAAHRFTRASACIEQALEILGEPMTQEEIERYSETSTEQALMEATNEAIRALKFYKAFT